MGNIFSIQLSGETIISHCWDCVAGQAAFICKLEDNLDALKTEVEKLKARSEGVTIRVRVAEEQHQLKPLAEVEQWCSRAGTVIAEADLLLAESPQQINKVCMGGCCSKHPRSSHKFGKQIAKKLQEVQDQWRDGDFSTVAGSGPLPSVTKRPSEPTVGLESTFDKVWSSLREEQVGIIGLFGQGGVGKTTLLKQINNRFLPNDFDYVIWVVASQDLHIEKVQEEIGKRIGFSDEAWKRNSLDEKAEDIFRVLCKKKFVLLLDDIWKRIELTRVGVPLPTQENRSKLIFTTRSFDVCSQMRACKKIEVKCLQQREAVELFEKNVGAETLASHAEIRELAEVVSKECAGLPLALVTIGRAMASKRTPEAWKHVIDRLRQSTASIFPEEVGKEMYPTLKCSYDCLPDEMVRSCFLYCSLYPEDFLIPRHDLIDCWIGEGLLDEHANLSSVQNQGHYIIGSLVDACLLEEEVNGDVKMHDVIRDMALWIAGEKFFVKAGVELKEQPKADKWEKVRRVSLMKNQIDSLTEIFVCPNLQTLFLGENELKVITQDFFELMPMLRVLDLSKNRGLEELTIGIAKLVSLEHLNLSHTCIRELPVELKALKKLKILNLEWTVNLEMIPQQLLSNFSKLQVLKMQYCGCEWSVEEMEHLKDLEVLTITFYSASMFDRAMKSYKFKSCNVEVVVLKDFRDSRLSNVLGLANLQHLYELRLYNCRDVEEVEMERAGITSVGCFHNLRLVEIIECSKLREASWIIFAPHLEKLKICNCLNFEEMMSEEKLDEAGELTKNSNLFSRLQILILGDLPKLKTIYRDALPFPRLKRIKIQRCPMLKKLPLNSESAKGQKMVIEGVEEWWENVEWEDETTRIAFLPSFEPLSSWDYFFPEAGEKFILQRNIPCYQGNRTA